MGGLTADQILRRKRLENLKSQQQKLSKIKWKRKSTKNNQSGTDLWWDNFKQLNIHELGASKWEELKNFEKIMAIFFQI